MSIDIQYVKRHGGLIITDDDDLRRTMAYWSKYYGVPDNLLYAIAIVESGPGGGTVYRRNFAAYDLSRGCVGLMQLSSRIATLYKKNNIKGTISSDIRLNDDLSIRAAAWHIGGELKRAFNGNVPLMIAAYHAGAPNVTRVVSQYCKMYNKGHYSRLDIGDVFDALFSSTLSDGNISTAQYMARVYNIYAQLNNMALFSTVDRRRKSIDPTVRLMEMIPHDTQVPAMQQIQYTDVTSVVDYDDPSFFKVGDVVLKVAPDQLSLHEENMIRSFDSVRTLGSPKISTGNEQVIIYANCMFSGLSDINGYYDGDRFIGGLRGMIAQYYRAPFLPIENKLIRSLLIPKDKPYIEEGIDKPRVLADIDREMSIYSKLIEGKVDSNNTLTSYIKNQISALSRYKQVVSDMPDDTTNVRGYVSKHMEIDETGASKLVPIAVALDSFSVSTVAGRPHMLNAIFTMRPFNYLAMSNDFAFVVSDQDAANQIAGFMNLANDSSSVATGVSSPVKNVRYTHNISESEVYRKYYTAIIDGVQSAYELPPHAPKLGQYTGDPYSNIKFEYVYTTKTRQTIIEDETRRLSAGIELLLTGINEGNLKNVDVPNWFFEQWWRYTVAVATMVSNGAKLVTNFYSNVIGPALAGEVVDYIFDPEKLRSQSVSGYLDDVLTRHKVPRDKFLSAVRSFIDSIVVSDSADPFITATIEIGGADTVVTGITATYQNKLAPLYTLESVYPTYQYVGGSDVNITVTLLTTDTNLLTELRLMSMRCAYTSLVASKVSPYRFIDNAATVTGDFFSLIGVRRVAFSDVVYSTTNDHPGLYEVQINLVQADMDLKQYESIYAADYEVTSSILNETMRYLMNTKRLPNQWVPDSVWTSYHNRLMSALDKLGINSPEQLPDAADKLVKLYRRDAVNVVANAIQDVAAGAIVAKSLVAAVPLLAGPQALVGVFVLLGGVATAYFAHKYIGKLADRLVPALSQRHLDRKTMTEGALELAAVRYDVLRSLITDADKLNSQHIRAELERIKESGARYNQCYGDMNLPTIYSSPLNTPADFFYKRGEIVTSDSIVEELKTIENNNIRKILALLSINAKEGDEAAKEFMDDYKVLTDQIRNLGARSITSMNELLSRFSRYQCTVPVDVLNVAKTINTAAMVKTLTEQINGLKDGKQQFEALARRAGSSAGLVGSQLDAYVRLKMNEYDDLIEKLNKQLMVYKVPGINMINTNQMIIDYDTVNRVMETNYYGQAFAGAESTLVKTLAMEARKRDQTLHMARAFPTFKLYFIEKDSNEWLLFDDFYSYSAISSIEIAESKKSASKTAVIRISNISGSLFDISALNSTEAIMYSDTAEEQRLSKLMLRVGCPIMIRMGYSNNPLELPMVFHGKIVEIGQADGGIEITAQSHAANLNEPITGKVERINMFDMRKAHGDIVTWALDKIGGLEYLGNRSVFDNVDDDIRRTFKDSMIDIMLRNITGIAYPNNPRDDNIYLPYNTLYDPLTRPTFDWVIDPKQTVWELMNEIVLYYTDYIVTVLPYAPDPSRLHDQRYTIYIGPVDGFYKWTDIYNDSDYKVYLNNVKRYHDLIKPYGRSPDSKLRLGMVDPSRRDFFFSNNKLLRCFKPVVDYHFYDSQHHIVSNTITASTDNMYNKVVLMYPNSKFAGMVPVMEPTASHKIDKFNGVYEVVADDDIPQDYIKTYITYQKNIDTNMMADRFAPLWIKLTGGDVSEGIPIYMRVANNVLANMMKEMYSGWLTVIGDPTVKPYDRVYMYDFENDMYGPFEVDTVVHRFDQNGYVTSIKPALLSHCQNFRQTLIDGYMNHLLAWSVVNAIGGLFTGWLSPFAIGTYRWGTPWVGKKVAGKGIERAAAAATGTRAGAAIGRVGSAASKWFLPAFIAYTIGDLANGIGATFTKEIGKVLGRQAILMTPLMYGGLPLVAGCEGWRTDDLWVHMRETITSIEDLPQYVLGPQ